MLGLEWQGKWHPGNGPLFPGPHSQTGPRGTGFVPASEQDQTGPWGPRPSLPVPSSPRGFPARLMALEPSA